MKRMFTVLATLALATAVPSIANAVVTQNVNVRLVRVAKVVVPELLTEDRYVVFTGRLDATQPPPTAFRVGTPGRYVFTPARLDASQPPLEGGLLGDRG